MMRRISSVPATRAVSLAAPLATVESHRSFFFHPGQQGQGFQGVNFGQPGQRRGPQAQARQARKEEGGEHPHPLQSLFQMMQEGAPQAAKPPQHPFMRHNPVQQQRQQAAQQQQQQRQQAQQQQQQAAQQERQQRQAAQQELREQQQANRSAQPTQEDAAPKSAEEFFNSIFPFANLFRSLGEVAPVQLHESTNHVTASFELPPKVVAKSPSVTTDGTGNIIVTAELSNPATAEEKMNAPEIDEQIKNFLGQLGMEVRHVGAQGSPAVPFRRSFYLDKARYKNEEAKAFIEDGILRVYVPRREVQQVPQQPPKEAPRVASAAGAGAGQESTTERRSYGRTEAPAAAPTSSTATAAPQPQQPAAAAQPAASYAKERMLHRVDTLSQWPPAVSTVEDNAKQVVYECRLPAQVDPANLSLEVAEIEGKGRVLKLIVEHDHHVKTDVSEETQKFTYCRYLNIPEETEVDAIDTLFDGENHTLGIVVPKPQPKKVNTGVRIPITKKQK